MLISQNVILENAFIVVVNQVVKRGDCLNFNINFENRTRRRKRTTVKTLTV